MNSIPSTTDCRGAERLRLRWSVAVERMQVAQDEVVGLTNVRDQYS